MDTQQIQVLLLIAERAQKAGLIQVEEMPVVHAAIMAGRQALKTINEPQAEPEQPGEGQKAKK